jgi:hypothetical protein
VGEAETAMRDCAGARVTGKAEASWMPGGGLPSGGELASYLAGKVRYPKSAGACSAPACPAVPQAPLNLLEVAQYFEIEKDERRLYDALHDVFDRDYNPSPVHAFLARLPSLLGEKACAKPHQFVVTTNYDDLMEKAMKSVHEPYDLVYYDARSKSPSHGRFLYRAPDAAPVVVKNPQRFLLPIIDRSVILKIHGAVARHGESHEDSYVITEEHYFDYPFYHEIPITLRQEFQKREFLFLGYSLSDWNLRMIFRRIWKDQLLDGWSWSINYRDDPLQKKFWERRKVRYIVADLADYVHDLEVKLQER